jgi:hypothetical protein
MSIENDFDPMGYAARIMKAKGFDVELNADNEDIFDLQWSGWQNLFNRHRIGEDLSKAEQLLTTFIQRETFGGPTKVIEAFAKHLEAQPRQGGSPDWSTAATEENDCPFCDNRGIVSAVPCRVIRKGEEVDRKYSFACTCQAGKRFTGIQPAEDWVLQHALDRKHREADRLHRWRQGRDAAGDTIADFRGGFRAWLDRQIEARKYAKSGTMDRAYNAIKEVSTAIDKEKADKAKEVLAGLKQAAKTKPPEQLNPERIALAAYANGDERNEWE